MAGGTASVLAGMICEVLMTAVFAFCDVSTHLFRPAGGYIGQCPAMTRQYPVSELTQVFSAMFANNLGQLDHG
jgi:hypothetical protein